MRLGIQRKSPDITKTTSISSSTKVADPRITTGFRQIVRRLLNGKPVPVAASSAPSALAPSVTSTGWRYTNFREIGRGGMGIIFRVDDAVLQRESAMKVALPAVIRDPLNAARFVGEGRITGRLEHPNIVPVHDLGETPEHSFYYTMKLVEGEPLSQILDRIRNGDRATARRFDRHQRLLIFRKICEAVAYAHAHRVIHRDIKPENVMVGAFGEVQVMDWGLAKHIDDATADAAPGTPAPGAVADSDVPTWAMLTRNGMVKGTPAFMSPEQATGRVDKIDFQTDIFLLGATLYNLVTFTPPYGGQSADEVISRAALAQIASPADVCPQEQIPAELCRMIEKAMAARKSDRYVRVEDLMSDLDGLMAGRVVCPDRVYAKGEYLTRAGEQGSEAYVILSGAVEVFREQGGQRLVLSTLGPGDAVGEMALLTDETRSASVVATQPTQVHVITADVMRAELRKLAPWMEKTVNALAQRLRLADQLMHPLLLGECGLHVAKQLLLLAAHTTSSAGREDVFLPRDVVVREISHNLAMPAERIAAVLERLLAEGIIDCEPATDQVRVRCDALTRFVDGGAGRTDAVAN